MKQTLKILILFIFIIVMAIEGCRKTKDDNLATLRNLYLSYKDGEISECKFNNDTVYDAAFESYSAWSTIYNLDGMIIGTCNYDWGPVDTICSQLQTCRVIYRSRNHPSGAPPIDVYGLGD
jgi:hypothetical protein